jgi:hypothetical protein
MHFIALAAKWAHGRFTLFFESVLLPHMRKAPAILPMRSNFFDLSACIKQETFQQEKRVLHNSVSIPSYVGCFLSGQKTG